jgi:hypothetical protein
MSKTTGGALWLIPSLAQIIFLAIFLSLSLSTGTSLLGDGDTGYHIRVGEYILQTLSVPRQDIFSFLTPALPWTAHEWLSEVIMALIYKLDGLTGVVLFFSLLIAAEFFMLFKMMQSFKGNILANILIVLLVILSSQVHWLARPHIFSLLLMTLWYYVLDQYQYRNRNLLYILPFVMLLWVNLHGGFMIALILSGIYFAGSAASFLTAKDPEKKIFRQRATAYGLLTVLCLLASLANPVGYRILLFPFRLTSDTFLMDNVHEFLSPNFHQQIIFKYLLLLTVSVFALSRKRVSSIELLLLVAFMNMSLYSARYIPLFGVIAAPILSRQESGIFGHNNGKFFDFFRKRAEKIAAVDESSKGHVWPLAAVLLVVILAAGGNISFAFDKKLKPVAAVDFLKQEHIEGNMYDNDEFGDYIIYAAWPEYRVFFDGRSDMYGIARMKDYLKVARVERGWEEVLKKYDIGWIIYNTDSSLALLLEERDDWKLIYSDKVAEIFVRNVPRYAALIAKYPDVRPVTAERDKGEKE